MGELDADLVLHVLSQARAAWPGVNLPCEEFADHLGRLYPSTARPRPARAQRSLRKEMEARLMRRLQVQRTDLISILPLVRSGLEVSLRLLFPRSGRMARRSG